MSSFVPIKLIQSVEIIYDLLTEGYSKFSLFKPTNNVDFEEKYKFVRSYSIDDLKLFIKNKAVQHRVFLAKVLEDIMKVIDSKYYQVYHISFQKDIEEVFTEFQAQLRNVNMRYLQEENRVLLHYSVFPTYSRDWNNLTLYSRGIVIDLDSYNVVVHPYDKFFNYLETKETSADNLPELPYEVGVKLDGSEGILYPTKDGKIRIITKGGFNTEHGKFATDLFLSKYQKQAEHILSTKLFIDYTFVFEILYDKNDINRIVVAYEEADLRLIGIRDLKTGRMLSYKEVIDFAKRLNLPSTEIENITLDEILELRKDRENFEGWVVRYENELYMKIKCEPYLDAHGARFGTSLKAVFNLIKEEKWDDFISSIAEENRGVPESLHKSLIKFAKDYMKKIYSLYDEIPKFENQKDFAIYVNKNIDREFTGFMFALRKGEEVNIFNISWSFFKIKYEAWEAKQTV